MASFPLLKLPLLAQKIIIQQIDSNIGDVIELSMKNRKWKRLLDLIKFDVESISFIFHKNYFAFNINKQTDFVNITSSFFPIQGSKNRRIDGDLVPVSHPYRKSFIGECELDTDKSKLDLLEKFTRHFLGFMKVQKFSVEFTSNPGVRNLFIWKYIDRFDKISFGPDDPDDIYMLPSQSAQMTSNDLVFLLENVTTDYLVLNCVISDNLLFKYSPRHLNLLTWKPSKIRKIKIMNSLWMDFDNLLRIDVESMEIKVPRNCINKILKDWIDGRNEKLEYLELKWNATFRDVMEGVDSTPSKFTNEELRTRSKNVSLVLPEWALYVITKDIRRNHDGCLATVIISDEMIEMLVWNGKHLQAIKKKLKFDVIKQ